MGGGAPVAGLCLACALLVGCNRILGIQRLERADVLDAAVTDAQAQDASPAGSAKDTATSSASEAGTPAADSGGAPGRAGSDAAGRSAQPTAQAAAEAGGSGGPQGESNAGSAGDATGSSEPPPHAPTDDDAGISAQP